MTICMQCLTCKHLIKWGPPPITCKAFPKGIPDEVIDGWVMHDHVLEGQVGDYVHEPIPTE